MTNTNTNTNTNARWVQDEHEEISLGLIWIEECYWQDKEDKYWFNDEVQVGVCGPYDSLSECKEACIAYAKTL